MKRHRFVPIAIGTDILHKKIERRTDETSSVRPDSNRDRYSPQKKERGID